MGIPLSSQPWCQWVTPNHVLYLEFKKIHYKMSFEHVKVGLDMLGLILLGYGHITHIYQDRIFYKS